MANSNHLATTISKRLSKHRLFYVCRDLERAMGSHINLPHYYIITNETRFSRSLAKQFSPHIILIKNKQPLDTAELLSHAQTKQIIQTKDLIMVFKNNTIIEKICAQNKWQLINPTAQLADAVESKISQIAWLGKLASYLPAHQVATCEKLVWSGKPFILQFNHSHTGSGTFFIKTNSQLKKIQAIFPKRPARAMRYINGPVFTNNNIVWGNNILFGNISYQITGLQPFTDHVFSTIGNDWALPARLFTATQTAQYKKIVTAIGKKLSRTGWKGLFGVDIIMDNQTGQLYLLEINARQPASTSFESQLQNLANQKQNGKDLNTFEAHIAALLNIPYNNYALTTINNGSQIVQRVTKNFSAIGTTTRDNLWSQLKTLASSNEAVLNILPYQNTTPGSDLARIQLKESIMAKHNSLNRLGRIIKISVC